MRKPSEFSTVKTLSPFADHRGHWFGVKIKLRDGRTEILFFASTMAINLLSQMNPAPFWDVDMPTIKAPAIEADDWNGYGKQRVVAEYAIEQFSDGALMTLVMGDARKVKLHFQNPTLALLYLGLRQTRPALLDLGDTGGTRN